MIFYTIFIYKLFRDDYFIMKYRKEILKKKNREKKVIYDIRKPIQEKLKKQ